MKICLVSAFPPSKMVLNEYGFHVARELQAFQAYRLTLIDKYRGENIHFRAHGILSARPEYPDFSKRGNPEHRILAFGKWGTYKRLELLLEAFQAIIVPKAPNARLIIAG